MSNLRDPIAAKPMCDNAPAPPEQPADTRPAPMSNSKESDDIEVALAEPGLAEWLATIGWGSCTVEPLAGDVSPRRYARVRNADGDCAILATYPQEMRETCDRFEVTAELLQRKGVPVPRILAADCASGRMLVEDLGSDTLYQRRDRGWTYLAPHITAAAELLPRIEDLAPDRVAAVNPPLDATLLAWELDNTWSLGLGGDGLSESLRRPMELMVERLAAASQVPCHRDFMARNLIPTDSDDPLVRVIDFQDLRIGPRGYDLASLLNDSLFAPPDLEEALVARLMPSEAGREQYHRAAAQRDLKIVGTYLGFARRGFPRHLHLVAPSLEHARRHLDHLPELNGLSDAIDELVDRLEEAAGAAAAPSTG